MDESALLQAFRQMLESTLESKLAPIYTRLESLEQGQASMQADISALKSDVATLKSDVAEIKQRVLKLEIIQENRILPNIQLLAEGHEGIIRRLDRLDDLPERFDELQANVSVLTCALKDHIREHICE